MKKKESSSSTKQSVADRSKNFVPLNFAGGFRINTAFKIRILEEMLNIFGRISRAYFMAIIDFTSFTFNTNLWRTQSKFYRTATSNLKSSLQKTFEEIIWRIPCISSPRLSQYRTSFSCSN